MELDVFPSDFGLLSVDPECLQFLACVKFCAAPVQLNVGGQRRVFSFQEAAYPVFHAENGQVITDFDQFVEFLRHSTQDVVLDGELTSSDKAEVLSFTAMVRNMLKPALTYSFWVDQHNYGAVTRQWYGDNLAFPGNWRYLKRKHSGSIAYLKHIYSNELITDAEIEFAVTKQALFCINMLSTKLGEQKYFYGDRPSSFDALVFGYLSVLLKWPLPNDRLPLHIRGCPNLVRFVESVISIYLPLTEAELTTQRLSRELWDQKRIRAQKIMKEERVRLQRERAQESDQQKSDTEGDFPVRDTILFAVAAVTVTMLFAFHTGLISITRTSDNSLDGGDNSPPLPVGIDMTSAFVSEYDQ